MNIGMLWFDNDQRVDLATKINRAAEYYQKKYGVFPDICYVHPSMITQEKPDRNGLEIKPNRRILPNHFWLGVQESSAQSMSP
ncbi:MAG: hypothetical protein AB1453_09580 [Chloroflexota bacterium]